MTNIVTQAEKSFKLDHALSLAFVEFEQILFNLHNLVFLVHAHACVVGFMFDRNQLKMIPTNRSIICA